MTICAVDKILTPSPDSVVSTAVDDGLDLDLFLPPADIVLSLIVSSSSHALLVTERALTCAPFVFAVSTTFAALAIVSATSVALAAAFSLLVSARLAFACLFCSSTTI